MATYNFIFVLEMAMLKDLAPPVSGGGLLAFPVQGQFELTAALDASAGWWKLVTC